MSIVETLISVSKQDDDVVRALKQHGDDETIVRSVDFLFLTSDISKAKALLQFINDQCYGAGRIEPSEDGFRLSVKICMPIQQHIILSVSGFMTCLAALFDLQYEGWGCPLSRPTTQH